MLRDTLFLLESLSATFILWLGLYVLTRDLPLGRESGSAITWQRPALIAGAGTLLLAIYLLGITMGIVAESAAEYLRWQRATWWTVPVASALFIWAISLTLPLINPVLPIRNTRWRMLWRRIGLPVIFTVAGLLALGVASGLILDTGGIETRGDTVRSFYTPMRPPFNFIFNGFVLAMLLGGALILLWRYLRTPRRSTERRQWRMLAAGSLIIVAGAATSLQLYPLLLPFAFDMPKPVGDYIVVAGAAVISYGIARHNALLHERVLEHDFWHSLASVGVTVAVYQTLFHTFYWVFGYAAQAAAVPLLSFLAVITQTPYNWEEALTDRLLLPRWAVGYRRRLGLMRRDLLTAPEPEHALEAAQETFDELVRETQLHELETMVKNEINHIFQYSRFADDEVMARSKLHELGLVASATNGEPQTDHQRAQSLRRLLAAQVDELVDSGTQNAEEARIEAAILRKKYIEGLSRTEVERHLLAQHEVAITGGAYSRALKSARVRLARKLLEAEVGVTNSRR